MKKICMPSPFLREHETFMEKFGERVSLHVRNRSEAFVGPENLLQYTHGPKALVMDVGSMCYVLNTQHIESRTEITNANVIGQRFDKINDVVTTSISNLIDEVDKLVFSKYSAEQLAEQSVDIDLQDVTTGILKALQNLECVVDSYGNVLCPPLFFDSKVSELVFHKLSQTSPDFMLRVDENKRLKISEALQTEKERYERFEN